MPYSFLLTLFILFSSCLHGLSQCSDVITAACNRTYNLTFPEDDSFRNSHRGLCTDNIDYTPILNENHTFRLDSRNISNFDLTISNLDNNLTIFFYSSCFSVNAFYCEYVSSDRTLSNIDISDYDEVYIVIEYENIPYEGCSSCYDFSLRISCEESDPTDHCTLLNSNCLDRLRLETSITNPQKHYFNYDLERDQDAVGWTFNGQEYNNEDDDISRTLSSNRTYEVCFRYLDEEQVPVRSTNNLTCKECCFEFCTPKDIYDCDVMNISIEVNSNVEVNVEERFENKNVNIINWYAQKENSNTIIDFSSSVRSISLSDLVLNSTQKIYVTLFYQIGDGCIQVGRICYEPLNPYTGSVVPLPVHDNIPLFEITPVSEDTELIGYRIKTISGVHHEFYATGELNLGYNSEYEICYLAKKGNCYESYCFRFCIDDYTHCDLIRPENSPGSGQVFGLTPDASNPIQWFANDGGEASNEDHSKGILSHDEVEQINCLYYDYPGCVRLCRYKPIICNLYSPPIFKDYIVSNGQYIQLSNHNNSSSENDTGYGNCNRADTTIELRNRITNQVIDYNGYNINNLNNPSQWQLCYTIICLDNHSVINEYCIDVESGQTSHCRLPMALPFSITPSTYCYQDDCSMVLNASNSMGENLTYVWTIFYTDNVSGKLISEQYSETDPELYLPYNPSFLDGIQLQVLNSCGSSTIYIACTDLGNLCLDFNNGEYLNIETEDNDPYYLSISSDYDFGNNATIEIDYADGSPISFTNTLSATGHRYSSPGIYYICMTIRFECDNYLEEFETHSSNCCEITIRKIVKIGCTIERDDVDLIRFSNLSNSPEGVQMTLSSAENQSNPTWLLNNEVVDPENIFIEYGKEYHCCYTYINRDGCLVRCCKTIKFPPKTDCQSIESKFIEIDHLGRSKIEFNWLGQEITPVAWFTSGVVKYGDKVEYSFPPRNTPYEVCLLYYDHQGILRVCCYCINILPPICFSNSEVITFSDDVDNGLLYSLDIEDENQDGSWSLLSEEGDVLDSDFTSSFICPPGYFNKTLYLCYFYRINGCSYYRCIPIICKNPYLCSDIQYHGDDDGHSFTYNGSADIQESYWTINGDRQTDFDQSTSLSTCCLEPGTEICFNYRIIINGRCFWQKCCYKFNPRPHCSFLPMPHFKDLYIDGNQLPIRGNQSSDVGNEIIYDCILDTTYFFRNMETGVINPVDIDNIQYPSSGQWSFCTEVYCTFPDILKLSETCIPFDADKLGHCTQPPMAMPFTWRKTDNFCTTDIPASCVFEFDASLATGNDLTYHWTVYYGDEANNTITRTEEFSSNHPITTKGLKVDFKAVKLTVSNGCGTSTFYISCGDFESSCISNTKYNDDFISIEPINQTNQILLNSNFQLDNVQKISVDFGDGQYDVIDNLSEINNLSHQYNRPGLYYLCFTIEIYCPGDEYRASNCCKIFFCKYIKIGCEQIDNQCNSIEYVIDTLTENSFNIQFYTSLTDDYENGKWTVNGETINPDHFTIEYGKYYECCFTYTDQNGCLVRCCRTIYIDPPFHCDFISSEFLEPAEDGSLTFNFILNDEYQDIIDWGILGDGELISSHNNQAVFKLKPSSNTAQICVLYYDKHGILKICCYCINILPPICFSNSEVITFSDDVDNGLLYSLDIEDENQDGSWSLLSEEGDVLDSDFTSSFICPPGYFNKTLYLCYFYRINGCSYYRCIPIICKNPYLCSDIQYHGDDDGHSFTYNGSADIQESYWTINGDRQTDFDQSTFFSTCCLETGTEICFNYRILINGRCFWQKCCYKFNPRPHCSFLPMPHFKDLYIDGNQLPIRGNQSTDVGNEIIYDCILDTTYFFRNMETGVINPVDIDNIQYPSSGQWSFCTEVYCTFPDILKLSETCIPFDADKLGHCTQPPMAMPFTWRKTDNFCTTDVPASCVFEFDASLATGNDLTYHWTVYYGDEVNNTITRTEEFSSNHPITTKGLKVDFKAVKLTVFNGCGTSTFYISCGDFESSCINNTKYNDDFISIEPINQTNQILLNSNFQLDNIQKISVDYGDGQYDVIDNLSEINNLSHQYNRPGLYYLCFTIEIYCPGDEYRASNCCKIFFCKYIKIGCEQFDNQCNSIEYVIDTLNENSFNLQFYTSLTDDYENGKWTVNGETIDPDHFTIEYGKYYECCFTYTDQNGCLVKCCRTIYIDSPFHCDFISSEFLEPAEDGSLTFNFILNDEYQDIIDWGILGDGELISSHENQAVFKLKPSSNTAQICVLYYDKHGVLKICCYCINMLPSLCFTNAEAVTFSDDVEDGLLYALDFENENQDGSWSLLSEDGEVLDSDFNSSFLCPTPYIGKIIYLCYFYYDNGCRYYRCIPIICKNPYLCNDIQYHGDDDGHSFTYNGSADIQESYWTINGDRQTGFDQSTSLSTCCLEPGTVICFNYRIIINGRCFWQKCCYKFNPRPHCSFLPMPHFKDLYIDGNQLPIRGNQSSDVGNEIIYDCILDTTYFFRNMETGVINPVDIDNIQYPSSGQWSFCTEVYCTFPDILKLSETCIPFDADKLGHCTQPPMAMPFTWRKTDNFCTTDFPASCVFEFDASLATGNDLTYHWTVYYGDEANNTITRTEEFSSNHPITTKGLKVDFKAVKLTVSNGCGTSTFYISCGDFESSCINNTKYNDDFISIEPINQTNQILLNSNFQLDNIQKISVDYGDGQYDVIDNLSEINNLSHQYNRPGLYYLCFTIEIYCPGDEYRASNCCKIVFCKYIKIGCEQIDNQCNSIEYVIDTLTENSFNIQFYTSLTDDYENGKWTVNGETINPDHFTIEYGKYYECCFTYTDQNGCLVRCCRTIYIDPPFHCDFISSEFLEPAEDGSLTFNFILNDEYQDIIDWGILGDGELISSHDNQAVFKLMPSSNTAQICVLYYDKHGILKICCYCINILPPNCHPEPDIITFSDDVEGGLLYALDFENENQDGSWSLLSEDGEVLDSDFNSSFLCPTPYIGKIIYLCYFYYDNGCRYYRCIPIICKNPYLCNDIQHHGDDDGHSFTYNGSADIQESYWTINGERQTDFDQSTSFTTCCLDPGVEICFYYRIIINGRCFWQKCCYKIGSSCKCPDDINPIYCESFADLVGKDLINERNYWWSSNNPVLGKIKADQAYIDIIDIPIHLNLTGKAFNYLSIDFTLGDCNSYLTLDHIINAIDDEGSIYFPSSGNKGCYYPSSFAGICEEFYFDRSQSIQLEFIENNNLFDIYLNGQKIGSTYSPERLTFTTEASKNSCFSIYNLCIGREKEDNTDYCGNQITQSIYNNNFEYYNVDDKISMVAPNYWSPVDQYDATIVDNYIFPSHQLHFNNSNGEYPDVILNLSIQTGIDYQLKWDMAFYDGGNNEVRIGDYYILDDRDNTPIQDRRIMRISFLGDNDDNGIGDGVIYDLANNISKNFTYPVNDNLFTDRTFENIIDFNFLNQEVEIIIDHQKHRFEYNNGFGGIEFYAGSQNQASDFVIDEICFGRKPNEPYNGYCQSSEKLECGISYTGNNYNGLNHQSTYDCHSSKLNAPEKAYYFDIGNDDEYILNFYNLTNVNLDLIITDHCEIEKSTYCYIDNSGAPNRSIDLSSLSSGKYYVFIDGANSTTQGEYKIQLSCQEIDCSSAIEIGCNQSISGDNYSGISKTSKYFCPSPISEIMTAPEKIYKFTPEETGQHTIKWNTHSNAQLHLFLQRDCPATECMQWTQSNSGRSQIINADLIQGQDYYIIIDGELDARGGFDLFIQCPKEDEECSLPDFDFSTQLSDSVVKVNLNLVSNVDEIEWDMGNGSTLSSNQSFEYKYHNSGTYLICGIAENQCGRYKICKEILVNLSNTSVDSNYILQSEVNDCLIEDSDQSIPIYLKGSTTISNLGLELISSDPDKIKIIGLQSDYSLAYNILDDGKRIKIYDESTINNYQADTPLFELLIQTGNYLDDRTYQITYNEAISQDGYIDAKTISLCLKQKIIDAIDVNGIVVDYQKQTPMAEVEFDLNGEKTYSDDYGEFIFDIQKTKIGKLAAKYVKGHARDRINVLDIKLIKHHWAEIEKLNSFRKVAADVNLDGRINSLDWGLLTRLLGHEIDDFSHQKVWLLYSKLFDTYIDQGHNIIGNIPDTLTITPESPLSPLEYIGVKIGDVSDKSIRNRSARETVFKTHIQKSGMRTKMDLYPQRLTNLTALQFCIDIENLGGENIQYQLNSKLSDGFIHRKNDKIYVVYASNANEIVSLNPDEKLLSLSYISSNNATNIVEISEDDLSSILADGAGELSKLRIKNNPRPQMMKVNPFPNPYTSHFELEIHSTYRGRVDIQLSNTLGQIVTKENILIENDKTSVTLEGIDKLPQGIYFGIIKNENTLSDFKIIKQ